MFIEIIWIIMGTLIGIGVGVLPGLGAATALSLLLPLSFDMATGAAIAFLMGIFVGAVYGGSITSILLNIPGSATSVATMFDGYPLTVKGQSLTALGASILSSSLGGVVGALFLMLVSPYIANYFIHNMDSPAYFWIVFIALTAMVSALGDDRIKGAASALLGFMVGTIGTDVITSRIRYTFGNPYLMDGIGLIPLILGLYAFSHIMSLSLKTEEESISKISSLQGSLWNGFKQTIINYKVLIKSIVIGITIGVFPGIGGATSNLIAYYNAKKSNNQEDTFGKGDIRGVIAPEASNNGSVASSLMPTFTLGIPGGASAAILLSVLMIHGLTPGPLLFEREADFVNHIFLIILIANVLLFPIALLTLRHFAKISLVKINIIIPIILTFIIYGTFGIRSLLYDVIILFVFAILGYCFKKYDIPSVPFLIAFILGPMFELNLRRALMAGDNNVLILLSRPLHWILAIILLLIIIGPILYKLFFKAVRN